MTTSARCGEEAAERPVGVVVVTEPLTRIRSRTLHARLRTLVRSGVRHVRVDLHQPQRVAPAGEGVLRLYSELLPRLGGSLTVTGATLPRADVRGRPPA